MKKNKLLFLPASLVAIATILIICIKFGGNIEIGENSEESRKNGYISEAATGRVSASTNSDTGDATVEEEYDNSDSAESGDVADDDDTPNPDEIRLAEEEERLVDAFDNLTDSWMNPDNASKSVTMADVDTFKKQFKQVPQSRKEECLQRALNLVPDDHIMLLAGILMDREIDPELTELVFNDILNRDEDYKNPILQQIYKDKTHPNWADAAWILDATGAIESKDASAPDSEDQE